MRAVFGHAVNVLWRHANPQKLLSDFARDRRPRHIKRSHLAHCGQTTTTNIFQNIHRVCRHAHDIGALAFNDPVKRRFAGGKVMDDELQARRKPLLDRNRTNVMA